MRHWLINNPFSILAFVFLEIYLDKNIGRIAPAFFAINSVSSVLYLIGNAKVYIHNKVATGELLRQTDT